MSSGIEILLFAPLLIPGVLGSAGTAAGVAGAVSVGTGAAATGGVIVTGSSVVTTSAFATGSIAASGGAATSVAAGATLASGAIIVVGAAGAALLAAHHLQSTYNASMDSFQQRIQGEQAALNAADRSNRDAASAALNQIQKLKINASESAELAFLRSDIQKLHKRLGDWPGVDPNLPGACLQLLNTLEGPTPDVAALFGSFELLNAQASGWLARQREQLRSSTHTNVAATDVLKRALEVEFHAMREEIELAPAAILSEKLRDTLSRKLTQIEGLVNAQPQMAEQGLQLLHGRIKRELTLGAEREAKQRETQEVFARRLRELAGRISARSQATIAVLENEELAASPVARGPVMGLQSQATGHLGSLADLLAGELPADLVPLEKLAKEADALFENTADQLRQIALQIYLESQIVEVFTQLGYQVTTVSDSGANSSNRAMLASVGGGQGVEVRVDGTGNLVSEMVALSSASTVIESHDEEKVCDLMDEVFEHLRARGTGVKEKKRRHARKGERNLRVVKLPEKQTAPDTVVTLPVARRIES